MLVNPLHIVFTLALSSAIGVSAQTPDACILGCVNAGLANSTCTSLSASFQSAAAACLTANCTAADQQAALQLQKQECSSSSSTSSSGASSTSNSTSSSPSATQKSNAITSIEQLPFLTVFVAIAGVALGGAFTL
ncbi:hypothetical protein F5148DRAFT_1286911 [Russula earlei]|uniref:Uncharacterized protein n=1 Tax=Russula earlei TaxID=71964 RepID=A0ACC0U3Y0_9AGAM|nr:hypothetical protein F5148DRAFT_1286911 [Russula earlei]